MPTLLSIAAILGGFVLLIKGADWLVDGASSIAQRLNIPDLVIGLTIVAFGTSAPELIVNIIASLRGNADIAIGNIVGSNIANTLLILGVAAMLFPLRVQRSTVLKEIPFSILAALVLFLMANDQLIDGYSASEIGRGDGLILMCFFCIFLYYTFGMASAGKAEDLSAPKRSTLMATGMMAIGLVGLGIGGEFVVRGATQIAELLGISQALIGLTIVAVGTSLPELMTSVIAALKHKPDISVGNIVGSNIFNIFWILGASAVIQPLPFSAAINPDLLVVIGSAVLLFLFIHTGGIHKRLLFWRQRDGHIITRVEGALLLACYVGYVCFAALRG
jgi:cation:H+ antiporter